MATFAAWMKQQEHRQDAVGEFARGWRDLDEKPKVSSPSGVFRAIEHVRDLAAIYPAVLDEYRGTRGLVPVPSGDLEKRVQDLERQVRDLKHDIAEVWAVLRQSGAAAAAVPWDGQGSQEAADWPSWQELFTMAEFGEP